MFCRRSAWPLALAVSLAFVSWLRPAAGQQPSLDEILAKAGEQAAALASPSRVLVCEETYKQKFEKSRAVVGFDYSGPAGARSDVGYEGVDQREWVAELALGTTANGAAGYPWMEFRDIYSVNGKPYAQGTPRLAGLSTAWSPAVALEAQEISQAGAKLLFGRLLRAIDLPRAATLFLHPLNQARFEFKKGGQRKVEGIQAVEVKFEEKRKPTIIRASGDKDAPSKGSFWIDPATGHVLMSVFKNADSAAFYDELTVIYKVVPEVGAALPARLTEQITDEEAGQRVQASATFTKWRAVAKTK